MVFWRVYVPIFYHSVHSTPTSEMYPLSLPGALPISYPPLVGAGRVRGGGDAAGEGGGADDTGGVVRAQPVGGRQLAVTAQLAQGGQQPPAGEALAALAEVPARSEEHTSELQSRGHLVCRLLLEKKKPKKR